MNGEIAHLWVRYRLAVRSTYEKGAEGGPMVIGTGISDSDLEDLVDASTDLTAACEELSQSDGGAEDAEAAALAAAAVDVAVAVDLLDSLSGEMEELSLTDVSEIRSWDFEEVFRRGVELESIEELLDDGDAVFLDRRQGMGGGAPAEDAGDRAKETVDLLASLAVPPTLTFGTGLITMGIGDLAIALTEVDALRDLAERGLGRLRHAIRLLTNGLRKLLVGIGGGGDLGAAVATFGMLELADALQAGVAAIGKHSVRKIVRAQRAEERINALVASTPALRSERLGWLEGELDELYRRYGKRMRSAATIGRRVRRGTPILVAIGGPVGAGAATGLNGVGLTYVLSSLARRLDNFPGTSGESKARVVPLLRQALTT